MGSLTCIFFFIRKRKSKGLSSRQLSVYEMFCLCKTYSKSGSAQNLLIYHIPLGRDHLQHTFTSGDGHYIHYQALHVRFIFCTNRRLDGFHNMADGCEIGKEGEARVCKRSVGCWPHLKAVQKLEFRVGSELCWKSGPALLLIKGFLVSCTTLSLCPGRGWISQAEVQVRIPDLDLEEVWARSELWQMVPLCIMRSGKTSDLNTLELLERGHVFEPRKIGSSVQWALPIDFSFLAGLMGPSCAAEVL